MSMKPVVKYITIPESHKLHCMDEIRGPRKGPIATPIRVPVEIIGKLLKQTPKVTVFECIEEGKTLHGKSIYSDKVELTLENYDTRYFEIISQLESGEAEVPPAPEGTTPDGDDTSITPNEDKSIILEIKDVITSTKVAGAEIVMDDKPVLEVDEDADEVLVEGIVDDTEEDEAETEHPEDDEEEVEETTDEVDDLKEDDDESEEDDEETTDEVLFNLK